MLRVLTFVENMTGRPPPPRGGSFARGGRRSADLSRWTSRGETTKLCPVPVVLAERHAACFLGGKAPSCLFTKNRLPLDPPLRPALPTIILIILRLCSMPGTFVASVSIGLVRPAICPVLGSFFFALFLFVSIVWYSTRIEGSYNYDI